MESKDLTAPVTFSNGQIIVAAGQPFAGLMTVKKGRLKRYRMYQSRAFLTGIVAEGETVGMTELLTFSAVHKETLEAVGDTVVLVHSKNEVTRWLESAPPHLLEALKSAQSKAPEAPLRRPVKLLPVRARVSATLWLLAQRHGRSSDSEPTVRILDLDLTREEIAHLAGTVYESVIRTLTSLKKEGVIDLRGRVIRILNENQLARIGQIALNESVLSDFKGEFEGEFNDQNSVSENRHSSNNGRRQEAI
jgi:CRP-like cAMP-binding protein